MPTTEWIGFAAEIVLLFAGLTAIAVWMSRRFDDMQRSVDQRFEAVDRRFDDMQRSMDRRFNEVKAEIGLVRAESRDAHAAIGESIRDVERRIGTRFDDMQGFMAARVEDFRDVTAGRIEDLGT